MTATTKDAAGAVLTGRTVTWNTGASNVATVGSDGLVTAVAVGVTTISATSEGKTGTATVTVREGALIGSTGGTVTAGGGAVVITVPAGALASSVALTATQGVAAVGHPGIIPGTVWDLGPVGTTFTQPVTVKIRYDQAQLPTGATPLHFSVRRLSGTSWNVLPGGTISATDRTVSATTTGFSTFAIVEPTTFPITATGFEDGSPGGWGPSGSETLTNTALAAHTGSLGLQVTNRAASWQGAGIVLTTAIQPGTRYNYTVWARLPTGQPSASMQLTMEWRAGSSASSYEAVTFPTSVTSAAWTLLQGAYSLPISATYARIKLESTSGTAAYLMDDFSITRVEQFAQQNIPALRDVLATSFKFGSAVSPADLSGEHRTLLLRHVSSITPGNDMKWEALQPADGQFTFAKADQIADFAAQNGLQLRGHTFVWHLQTPEWVFKDSQGNPMTPTPANKALLLARMDDHIRAVGARYAGKAAVWDVVNEVIDATQPDGLRRSVWYNIIGPEYIAHAFTVARQVLPNAKLFINEYSTEQPARREALYNLVAQLKAQGVPIDGVGHQLHINIDGPSVALVEQAIQRFIPLGVVQEITEMDISVYHNASEAFATRPADRTITQANLYRDYFDMFRRHAGSITTVTLWGHADDDTWLDFYPVVRKDWPLLFDEQLLAKPAYWGIVDPQYMSVAPLWARSSVAIPPR